ncbi:MAG TPA: YebC/PmpR family DNA-binding transcriptional regulator [Acidobacteriota bacterium]|nr:YebC/PmpR family DNA-binding transcriptional regulator [Acidobacteriota bacterium]
MSGHSKWSTIKRKKGKTDAARGRMFTRLIKEITISARNGGGDTDINPRLRTAVQAAKAANMPADNIKKAIQRGTGELPGVNYEEVQYEAYGPSGVAILINSLTDNRNRTVAEIRHLLGRHGGNMGEAGCVNWMFTKQGVIEIESSAVAEDHLFEIALEAGASDMKSEGGAYAIITPAPDFETVRAAVAEKGIPIADAELAMVPQSSVSLEGKDAEAMLRLMDALEEHEDVQNVYANFDIDDALIEQFNAE